MDKVVRTGLKFDLHIHSAASAHKDGAKVKNNTFENIGVLIEKLNQNEVNLCAITDHDTFSYKMYQKLKEAESQSNSIQKVLPGVEFSVYFESEGQNSVVHVVTIFSDEDDTKVQNLEGILLKNRPDYKDAYREEKFLALLREANINTIFIAHQKNTLTSQRPRKNDANSLGNQEFLEFVYTDYFEAFEFKNKRNEVLNKIFLLQQNIEGRLRFVTGTDCHDWSVYPSETPESLISDFPYTYAKCLPTFKGLVMAITDHNRLKYVNSFFNVDKKTLDQIEFPLFEWPVCAGDGFYFDQANVPFEEIEVENLNADYAVRISGKSMEPTIMDGSTALVKQVEDLLDGDIGIFNVNGEIMCKRYIVNGEKIILKPDNESGMFSNIDTSQAECILQGKVLLNLN